MTTSMAIHNIATIIASGGRAKMHAMAVAGKQPSRWRRGITICFVAGLAAIGLVSGCSDRQFSQLDGFVAIRASLSQQHPTAAEQDLIAQHRPQLYTAAAAAAPIDFYADYIAYGELQAGATTIHNPTAADLNAHRHNPAAVFTHNPVTAASKPPQPVAYGGIETATVSLAADTTLTLTFLSYHFVFRQSGLAAGISTPQKWLADFFASRQDWHQLDHYTAVFIVLAPTRPIAYILQQHNYMRTYLISDPTLPVAVDAAVFSNELYPHSPQRQTHRASGFLTADSADYLLRLSDRRRIADTTDTTHGQKRVDYEMRYLPPNDAFYVFEGRLGERRFLPGRDGPPGALYRSVPQLWALPTAFYAFYWQEQDAEYARLLRRIDNFYDIPPAVLAALRHRLAVALRPFAQAE